MLISWLLLALTVILPLFSTVICGVCFGEPIPLSRYQRSIPVFQLIPVRLITPPQAVSAENVSQIAAVDDAGAAAVKRQARKLQSQIVNVNVNQGSHFGHPSGGFHSGGVHAGGFHGGAFHGGFGGGAFGGGFLAGGFGGGGFHGFARSNDGGAVENTYTSSSSVSYTPPACPTNYIISCQPTWTPAPCSSSSSY